VDFVGLIFEYGGRRRGNEYVGVRGRDEFEVRDGKAFGCGNGGVNGDLVDVMDGKGGGCAFVRGDVEQARGVNVENLNGTALDGTGGK
jgi:hypothetical protein